MKGTAPRGRWPEEDELFARQLRESAKERAENLMIVDLLRNDLGRVSRSGTVITTSLFDVESFETVHQMTSTITSEMNPGTGFTELLGALFPCGSVTGAPKKRSMEIIAELEDSPRGLYTGCIGYISPGMEEAVFSVAIRSLVIDGQAGAGELGVGSGVTWDSSADAEYEECLAKGLFAREMRPEFTLIESLLFEEGRGYFLLDLHLRRLESSSGYFGFAFDRGKVLQSLEEEGVRLKGKSKVRLELSRDGSCFIEVEQLGKGSNPDSGHVRLAAARVDSSDPFLYHKTSNRNLYSREAGKRPDCFDVIFLNERGEITEGANNNIVIRRGKEMLTPKMECGLLPGTFRQFLLNAGEIREGTITSHELESADEIYLINSVRKWRRVYLLRGD
jgi:para-aminobenzoate synthetase/4-amino-4-deoxychorismate lyase